MAAIVYTFLIFKTATDAKHLKNDKHNSFGYFILGDPGATSRDDAIFSG